MKTPEEKNRKKIKLLQKQWPVISQKGKSYIVGGGEKEDSRDEF